MKHGLALSIGGALVAACLLAQSAVAAPLPAKLAAGVTAESSLAQVHWRRWHHCHRVWRCKHGWCGWRTFCHGGGHHH